MPQDVCYLALAQVFIFISSTFKLTYNVEKTSQQTCCNYVNMFIKWFSVNISNMCNEKVPFITILVYFNMYDNQVTLLFIKVELQSYMVPPLIIFCSNY
jgi:hypothetical protein